MTTIHNVNGTGRAFRLRSAIKTPVIQNTKLVMRELASIAHTKGCYVRENNGKLIPVQPKWLLGQLNIRLSTLRIGMRVPLLFSLLSFAKRNGYLSITRRQLDWFQTPAPKKDSE